MMICFFKSEQELQSLSSRKTGEEARVRLLNTLNATSDRVVLDFAGKSLSPSFADEFIGIAAKEIGLDEFKRRVSIINVNHSNRSIIKHVLSKRLLNTAETRDPALV